ncbi:exodeoxyribonuclease III [Taylorella equigenitalis]|uniref:exodeoxyribonuclease III n=1 Tax=Taylorella equigenitalis TaxID=29575 RepID=UPI002482B9A6|nr:exodeoxyribonuclease III [Taylorella equigenitalis]WGU10330.1 exodeoxyribonuclease III [Taylorella equigenitalis]
MLRITSLNVNGLRSAFNKGIVQWLSICKPDIVCLQEIKISAEDLTDSLRSPLIYKSEFNHAERKGYSGVGIYLREELDSAYFKHGIENKEFDPEGRVLSVYFKNLTVVSAYLPSGSSGDERQRAKFRFLDSFGPWIDAMMRDHVETGHEYVICGDWNMAHKEIDLKNWKSNLKNSGFTPEEREWMNDLLERRGFVDVFRRLCMEADQYTWWSNRGQAWAKNVGWRIDYQIATPGIATLAKHAEIYKGQRFSDHAPLTIDYDFKISR